MHMIVVSGRLCQRKKITSNKKRLSFCLYPDHGSDRISESPRRLQVFDVPCHPDRFFLVFFGFFAGKIPTPGGRETNISHFHSFHSQTQKNIIAFIIPTFCMMEKDQNKAEMKQAAELEETIAFRMKRACIRRPVSPPLPDPIQIIKVVPFHPRLPIVILGPDHKAGDHYSSLPRVNYWQPDFDEHYSRCDIDVLGMNTSDPLEISLNGDNRDGALKLGIHYTHVGKRISIVSLHGIPLYRKLLTIAAELFHKGIQSQLALPLIVKCESLKNRDGSPMVLPPVQMVFHFATGPGQLSMPFRIPPGAPEDWKLDMQFFGRTYSSKEKRKLIYLLNLYMRGLFDLQQTCMNKRTQVLLNHLGSQVELVQACLHDARAQIADYFEMVLQCHRDGKELDCTRWVQLEKQYQQSRRRRHPRQQQKVRAVAASEQKEEGPITSNLESEDENGDSKTSDSSDAADDEEEKADQEPGSVVPTGSLQQSNEPCDSEVFTKIMEQFAGKYRRAHSQ